MFRELAQRIARGRALCSSHERHRCLLAGVTVRSGSLVCALWREELAAACLEMISIPLSNPRIQCRVLSSQISSVLCRTVSSRVLDNNLDPNPNPCELLILKTEPRLRIRSVSFATSDAVSLSRYQSSVRCRRLTNNAVQKVECVVCRCTVCSVMYKREIEVSECRT